MTEFGDISSSVVGDTALVDGWSVVLGMPDELASIGELSLAYWDTGDAACSGAANVGYLMITPVIVLVVESIHVGATCSAL